MVLDTICNRFVTSVVVFLLYCSYKRHSFIVGAVGSVS